MQRTARILIALLPALLLSGACTTSDLGRYCVVGSITSIEAASLNPAAPECGDRLCLKQLGYRCGDGNDACSEGTDAQGDPLRKELQPNCSSKCETNDDCVETDDNVNACAQYVCQIGAVPTGDFSSRCLCTCLDYIRQESGAPYTIAEFNDSSMACGASN